MAASSNSTGSTSYRRPGTSRSSRSTSCRTRSAPSTRSSGSRPGRTTRARSSSSTPRRRRRTGASTCRRSTPTSSPSPAHKMCGPTSVGALWGRLELLEAMEPFNLGGHMIRRSPSSTRPGATSRPSSRRGRQPIAEAVGFGAAVDYLEAAGLDAIEAWEHELTDVRAGAARRRARHHAVRPAAGEAGRDRRLQPRRDPPARRGADPGHGRRRDPRRPPLHASR